MNDKLKGTLLVLFAACSWGLMGIFVRNLYHAGLSNMDINFCRCIMSAVGYMGFVAWKNPKALKVDKKGFAICAVYGMVVYGISFLSYNAAIQRIPMGVATALIFMCPIWVSLMGKVIFKDKLDKFKYAMIAACIFGVVLAANLFGSLGAASNIFGLGAAVFNGMGMALQIMVPRYFGDKYDYDAMLTYGFLGATLMLSIGRDFGAIYETIFLSGSMKILIDVLIVGVFCTMLANGWYTKAGKYISSVSVSMLAVMEVVVGSISGYVIYTEVLHITQWMGIVIIISSVIAFRCVKLTPRLQPDVLNK